MVYNALFSGFLSFFVFYRQKMDEKNCHKKMIKYGILRLVTD